MVNVYPGHKLLFPEHYLGYMHFKYMEIGSKDEYYTDNSKSEIYDSIFVVNWSYLRNIFIFTLFCTHVTKKSTWSRFYIQMLVNQILTSLRFERWD